MKGDTAGLKSALDDGGDVDEKDATRSAVEWACRYKRVDCLEVLLEAGASITAHNDLNFHAIHTACSEGRPRCAELLIKHSADLTAQDVSFTLTTLSWLCGNTSEVHCCEYTLRHPMHFCGWDLGSSLSRLFWVSFSPRFWTFSIFPSHVGLSHFLLSPPVCSFTVLLPKWNPEIFVPTLSRVIFRLCAATTH